MKSKILIREIREEDYPALLEIENIIWTKENSPVVHYYASITEYKEKCDGQTIFVATDQKKMLGFIDVHHPTPLASHEKQWMIGIGVHPDSQSLGIGTLLIEHIKTIAPNYGIHKLSLRVMATNKRAIAFYKKIGWIQEALFKDEFFVDGHYYDDYQFAYFLS